MLSVNLCVSFGLYNGAIGNIIDIIYLEGNIPENSLPAAVMVEFPNYKGPSFVKDDFATGYVSFTSSNFILL
jgi:hypothetical protein